MEVGESKLAEIHARKRWNDTGIDLRKGAQYLLEVIPPESRWTDGIGPWNYDSDANGAQPVLLSLSGFLKRCRSARWFTLIGARGKDKRQLFPIGKRLTLNAESDFRLFCFANDFWLMYWNNSGKLDLQVTRIA